MILASICIAWVFAATGVAMLPMRHQYIPGAALLAAAPVLIFWISIAVTWWAGLLALGAFLSMFRNPLHHFWAKARGFNPQLPPEPR